MRTNLPVTNNEVEISDQQSIVSKTDLKGRISYVNDDYVNYCLAAERGKDFGFALESRKAFHVASH